MTDKTCARCHKALDLPSESAWTKASGTVYYCHATVRSCYVLSTWDVYPELNDDATP